MSFTKYLSFLLALLMLGTAAKAQPYGNEWINYGKTYYKMKVGREGIYRIPKSALPASISNAPGSEMRLFRDGQQVPIYVSTTGVFGTNDYIEFYGTKADGKLDKDLYSNPLWHPDDRISMFTDTAAYFLVADNAVGSTLYTSVPNNIPSNPPTPQPFGIVTVGQYFVNTFVSGRNVVNGQHIPLSLFDNGEGYVASLVSVATPLSYNISTPNVVNSGNATVNLSVIRNTYAWVPIPMKVELNGQQIANETLQVDETHHVSVGVSPGSLTANNQFTFTATPSSSVGSDSYGVSFLEIEYPRNFDLSGLAFFTFKLNANSSNQYLEFLNLQGSGAPRLYDVTSKKWYMGDVSVAGKARFFIDPSFTDRTLVLYSESSNQIASFSTLQEVTFKDYSQSGNQGNYILVTHSKYDASTNGHNYISEYRDYRASVAGGGYQVVVADVNQLYDQFGFGQDIQPLSIKRFLQYAYDKFTVKPHDVFMVGKGLHYHKYRTYLQSPSAFGFTAIVPTFGDPGSDVPFVNFLPNRKQAMNIARLNAWTPEEVGHYLQKIKEFESALSTPVLPTHETELWKKHALHAAGGDKNEQPSFIATLDDGAAELASPLFGGVTTTVAKSTTVTIDPNTSKTTDSLINNGLSFICYHGHSASSGFQYNLNSPEIYTNRPRLPHFVALGCDVAQIFTLNPIKTVSEKYLAADGGSITMIAADNPQYAGFHAIYLPSFYSSVSQRNYGKTIGDHHHYVYDSIQTKLGGSESNYFHLESMLLQGDPAARTYGPAKPDYHVAANRISSIPANVTTNLDSFTLKIVSYNLAQAVNDSVSVKVEHTNPANATKIVKTYKIPNLYSTDTTMIRIAVDKIADIGLNKIRITIDDLQEFDETSEGNNIATLDLFIYSDNLVPVYPQEFAIVNKQAITLKASTLNPFRTVGRYLLEIDTTEQFNSPAKQQTSITSEGGVIKWTPSITYQDSVVYYWRTAFDSAVNGAQQWSYSSFIYLANGSPGWNQSHYYQYKKNTFNSLELGTDRTFRYTTGLNQITASNAIYDDITPLWPWNQAQYVKVMYNGSDIQRLGCYPWDGTLQINVFDSITNLPWANDSAFGTSGAYPVCLNTRNAYTFEFPVNTVQGRNNAAHFLDSIPAGNYVLVRNMINLGKYDTSFVDEWKTDPGNSLYASLTGMGFNQIDSFNQVRPFIFFRKKGNNSFPVSQFFGKTMLDTLVKNFYLPSFTTNGNMNSTTIGPAQAWQQLKWAFSAPDNQGQNDKPFVTIYGVDKNNITTVVYQGVAKDTSLSFINAAIYPQLRMVWTSFDSLNLTSPQLSYWRVLYSPVPEAALNPAAKFAFTDSLNLGKHLEFVVAVENLTELPMDSMLVKYKVIDASNNTYEIASRRYRKLPGNDTLHAFVSFDPSSYHGDNVFFIEVNPDNDQPEQYHGNNLGYIPFKVIPDESNPLLDVTFDGIHILDRDIVSAKPFIKITLRDENQYLALNDTSLLSLRIRYPSDIGNTRLVPFDGTISKFIPANPANGKNEATIEYRPDLKEDGIYDLFVNGRDRAGNESGNADYKVSFEVINKSSITNILNYPNPFSTSTAFVFTMTGSQLPSQFKIQIMTVTGKVVREITRQELGPLHIGRNITEYKWDGKDQYGQTLGNGVYLYRVVTAINGSGIEHRESGVDKFYKNGYGKLYIMR